MHAEGLVGLTPTDMDIVEPPLRTKIHSGLQENGTESLRLRFLRGVSWNLVGTVLAQGSVFMANVGIAYLRYKVLGRGGFSRVRTKPGLEYWVFRFPAS